MVLTYQKCRMNMADRKSNSMPLGFYIHQTQLHSNKEISWWKSVTNCEFETSQKTMKHLNSVSLVNMNNMQLQKGTPRFSNTKEYLKFKYYVKNNTKQCTLDISMLDILTTLGSCPSPFTYSMLQATCSPREVKIPEILCFLDTESYSEKTSEDLITLKPYLLMCKVNDEMMTYDIITHGKNFMKHFLMDLMKKFSHETSKKMIFVVAHNFSGHDALMLMSSFTSLISENHCNCSIVYHSGKVYNLTMKWKNSKDVYMQARFQCSLMLFQSSLESVSQSFYSNLKKLPMPHKAISNLKVLKSKNMNILLDHIDSDLEKRELTHIWKSNRLSSVMDYTKYYCQNDVKMLDYIYTNFKLEYEKALGTGEMSNHDFMTISRLAQTTWGGPMDFNERLITNIPNYTPAGKYLMTAYYGGKCEVYKGFLDKDTHCYYFDYPGMYSLAMQQPIPIGVPVYMDCSQIKSPHFFIKALHKSGMCAYLTVTFKSPSICNIPILPYKTTLSDSAPKLMFCAGKTKGTYFTHELEHSIEKGYKILEIHHGYAFNSYKTLKSYSNYMTQMKEVSKAKNDKIRTLMYKLLANSLYGKFGMQRRSRSMFAPMTALITLPNIKQFFPIDESMSIACVHVRDASSATNLAVAASVASWGRIILSSGVNKVLSKNPQSKLMYVDTDSMFFQSPSEIKCDNMWKKINWTTQATYKDVKFLASKFYALKDLKNHVTVKMKGVKSSYIDLDMFQHFTSSDYKVTIKKMEQWKKASLRAIYIKSVDKTITPYDTPKRRLVMKEGSWTGITIPYNFKSIESRSHSKFMNSPNYGSPPFDFGTLENVQYTPTQYGKSYSLDEMSFFPLPVHTPFVHDYSISYPKNSLNWSTLYYLLGWVAKENDASRLGILSMSETLGTEVTLTSEYLKYPVPYNSIGSTEFKLYMNSQMMYYAERYSISSQETHEMLSETGLMVRLLCLNYAS